MTDIWNIGESSEDQEFTAAFEPGEQVPSIGYPTGGGDITITPTVGGGFEVNVYIPSGASGGYVTSNVTPSSVAIGLYIPPPTVETEYEDIPPPPSINSNEYAVWLATYAPEDPDPEPTPVLRSISGYLTDPLGTPLEVVVVCHNRETHAIVGETTSDPITGFYEVDCYTIVEHYLAFHYLGQIFIQDKVICVADDRWAYDLFTIVGAEDWELPFPVTLDGDYYVNTYIKPDGLKAWSITNHAQEIVEFDLATKNDLGTAIPTATLSMSITAGSLEDAAIFWKSDGTKFYVSYNDDVYEFTCSTAWDMSTSGAVTNWTNDAASANGLGLQITPDGSKLTVINRSGTSNYDRFIQQYDLTTPWDLYPLTYDGRAWADFSLAYYYPRYSGFSWNDDGTKLLVGYFRSGTMYEFDCSADPYDIDEATEANSTRFRQTICDDGQNFIVSPDGTTVYQFGTDRGEDFKTRNHFCKSVMSTPWDLSTLSHPDLKYIISPNAENSNANLFVALFSPDGTKLSIITSVEDVAYYELSTAWDLATATLIRQDNSLWDGEGLSSVWDGAFSASGEFVFLCDDLESRIYEVEMSTPFDFTSGQGAATVDPWSVAGDPHGWYNGIEFSTDGMMVFLLDVGMDNIISCPLEEAFYLNNNFLYDFRAGVKLFNDSRLSDCVGLFIDPDGKRAYTTNSDGYVLYFKMSTPWDLDTMTYEDTYQIPYISYYEPLTNFFSRDGTKIYVQSSWGLLQLEVSS